MTGWTANTEGKIKDESVMLRSLKEQVQVNRKCQYWKKGWTGERGRKEERRTVGTEREIVFFAGKI